MYNLYSLAKENYLINQGKMDAGTYAWHKEASTLLSKKKEKMGRASFYSIAFFSKFSYDLGF